MNLKEIIKLIAPELNQLGFKQLRRTTVFLRFHNKEFLHVIYLVRINGTDTSLYSNIYPIHHHEIQNVEMMKVFTANSSEIIKCQSKKHQKNDYSYNDDEEDVNDMIKDIKELLIPRFHELSEPNKYLEFYLETMFYWDPILLVYLGHKQTETEMVSDICNRRIKGLKKQ